MTTHQSTAVTSGLMPDKTIPGLVLCRTGHITTANDNMVSGDTLEMVPVPNGAKIIDLQVAIDTAISGATGTEIGDGTSNGRFLNGVSFGDGNIMSLGADGVIGCLGYEYEQDDTIDIFLRKAATKVPTSTKITMNVWYKMAGSLEDEDNLTI